jgi:hypothetical protein
MRLSKGVLGEILFLLLSVATSPGDAAEDFSTTDDEPSAFPPHYHHYERHLSRNRQRCNFKRAETLGYSEYVQLDLEGRPGLLTEQSLRDLESSLVKSFSDAITCRKRKALLNVTAAAVMAGKKMILNVGANQILYISLTILTGLSSSRR